MMNNSSADSAMLNLWMSNTDASFSSGRIIASKTSTTGVNGGITLSQWYPPNAGASSTKHVKFSHDISYAETIKAESNLGAYYRFDDASGTSLSDSSGNGTNMTISASDWSFAQTGALIHESTNKAMSQAVATVTTGTMIPNTNTFKPGSSGTPNGSIELWFKIPVGTAATTNLNILSYYTTVGSDGYAFRVSSNQLQWVGDSPSTDSSYSFTTGQYIDGQWHHLAVTYAPVSSKINRNIYVDGLLINNQIGGSANKTYAATPTARGLFSSNTGSSTGLSIDEMAFFTKTLTQAQVENHYAAGIRTQFRQAQFPANPALQLRPVGFWRMGDTFANRTALDSSGFGNHGVYTGNGYVMTGTYGANTNTYRYNGIGTGSNYASENDNLDGAYQPGVAATAMPAATPAATPNPSTDYVRVPYADNLKFSTTLTAAGWIYIPTQPASNIYANDIIGQPNVWALHWAYSSSSTYSYLKFCTGGTTNAGCSNFASTGTNTNFLYPFANNWVHVAVVYNGSGSTSYDQVKFYINGQVYQPTVSGTLNTNLSTLYTSTTDLRIGGGLSGLTGINRTAYDDFAVYNKALTAAEIQALYTDSSFRYCATDIATSSGSTLYDNISVLYDKLLNMTFLNKNGKQECAIKSTGINMASDTSTFQIGDSTNSFVGNLYSAQVYSSDSTAHVATSYNQVNNFAVSADQLRPQQIGLLQNTWNSTTNSPNLILDYEASVSRDGMRSWDSGSISTTSTPQLWRDNAINQIAGTSAGDITLKNVSTNAYPGVLVNFTNANYTWSAYGSVGSLGQSAYYLGFLGSSNMYVDAGSFTALNGTKNTTVCTWMYGVGNGTSTAIIAKGAPSSGNAFFLGYDNTTSNKLMFNIGGTTQKAVTNSALSDSTWYYVCGSYDGTAASSNIKLYVNGAVQTTTGAYTSNIANSAVDDLAIGAYVTQGRAAVANSFTGGIGAVQIYNTTLTGTKIYNNCVAQAANYTATAPTTFCTTP
jgi:hypothetical protein